MSKHRLRSDRRDLWREVEAVVDYWHISMKMNAAISAVSLTPGKLSAVRAAFKAGVTPSKIAKEFGLSQADVRSVIASDKR